jgi:hypothetical protein|tara:strand:- start:1076 stop:1399 length:324 start_codon:yes stop_codon:yes gene_type:complete
MGRKRVANPRISFSISMSQSMKQQIDHRLGYNTDRSKWIVSAIHDKLKGKDDAEDALDKATLKELMSELNWRANHPAFKHLFTRGMKEMIVNLSNKATDLDETSQDS